MKKITILLSCILLAIAVGCAKQSPEGKLASVTIAFQDWVGYGPFYLAQEKGFFKEEGIELVFVDEQLDSARRDAFKQGMLDCEAGTIDLLVSKTAQDTPITAVMEVDMSFGADAIVAADNIKTLKDLEGKRVALARDDVEDLFLSVLFYKNGLPVNSLAIVPQRPEDVAKTFLSGEADACATWEPQVSDALKRPGAHILASSRDYPGIIIDTLNVRRDLAEKDPGLVKKVMRAWFKGLKYYREHPLEGSEIIAKYYKITPAEYRKQVEGLKWIKYEDQDKPSERQEWSDDFNAIAKIKLADNRISQKPDAAKALNITLLEKLYEDSQ